MFSHKQNKKIKTHNPKHQNNKNLKPSKQTQTHKTIKLNKVKTLSNVLTQMKNKTTHKTSKSNKLKLKKSPKKEEKNITKKYLLKIANAYKQPKIQKAKNKTTNKHT